MTGNEEDIGTDDRDEEFADLIGRLDTLGRRLDGEGFPGSAWPVRRGRRPLVLRVFVAAAAAAVLLVAAAAWWQAVRPADRRPLIAKPPTTAPVRQRPLDWSVPSVTAPSLASGTGWRVPSLSIPSTRDPNGIGWSIPAISFPSLSVGAASTTKTKATSRPQARSRPSGQTSQDGVV